MTRARGTGAPAFLVALFVSVLVFAGDVAAMAPRTQDAADEIIEIGSGPLSERSITFVGRNQYRPDSIFLFGYLTFISGLDANGLYGDARPSLATAQFTFTAEVGVDDTQSRADITSSGGAGRLRIYFDEAASALWEDPGTFADGVPVAEYSLDLQDTLQRQAPGVGVIVGDGQLKQTTAKEFSVGSDRARFGHEGIAQRIQYVGAKITGTSGESPVATVTGFITVTSRDSLAVRIVDPRSPAAQGTPLAQGGACAELQPWLAQSKQSLEQAIAAGAVFDSAAALGALDPAPLREAAASVSALAAGQRAIDVPQGAGAANRLVVTGISTYARGLAGVAAAAAAQDPDLLAESQSAVRDGVSLIGRAGDTLAAVADGCPGAGTPASS